MHRLAAHLLPDPQSFQREPLLSGRSTAGVALQLTIAESLMSVLLLSLGLWAAILAGTEVLVSAVSW